jgi:hypothetical protein
MRETRRDKPLTNSYVAHVVQAGALQGTIALVAIGNGFALDAKRAKVALADRRGATLMQFVAHGAVGLVVVHQFVNVFGSG